MDGAHHGNEGYSLLNGVTRRFQSTNPGLDARGTLETSISPSTAKSHLALRASSISVAQRMQLVLDVKTYRTTTAVKLRTLLCH